jgi:midasin (ATPase involved in ribosome maturation)
LSHVNSEYIQLHRDTTVQTLTISPTLREGVIVYEDSPLVKAVEHGRVLVIDEADKAPLEVVSILKGLVEDGEMALSDGRRIVSVAPTNVVTPLSSTIMDTNTAASTTSTSNRIIVMHPNFRVMVLANRPGFPFLV